MAKLANASLARKRGSAEKSADRPLSELQKLYDSSVKEMDPSVDPLPMSGTFDQSTFGRVAREYFTSSPDLRKPNKTLEMFEQALAAYFGVNESRLSKILGNIDGQAKKVSEMIQTTAHRVVQTQHEFDQFTKQVGDPLGALEGFKTSIAESLKLQEARKLWGDSARRARRDYGWSWAALIALLVVVPAVAIANSSAIFDFFRAIGDAVLVDLPENASETAILIAAVSRLVLVTLPVALFIWLIRIVVRFNARSLLLMDDANQRNTMLETYLHLVEQDAEVKSDRPLILEALFRRTPGHGPETIEPPNLADILRIGTPTSPVSK